MGAAHPFGLEDAAFWVDDAADLLDELGRPRLEEGGEELVIDGPRLVELERRSRVPILVHHQALLASRAKVDFRQEAVVTAVELETGRLHVRRALDELPDLAPPPAEGEAAEEEPEYTDELMAEGFALDLRERFPRLPWRPQTLLVTLLLRGRRSNRTEVRLGTTPGVYADPEVAAHLARAALPPPHELESPERGDPLPSYAERPGSPRVPAEPGIALAIARRTELLGSFLLPPRPSGLVGIELLILAHGMAGPIVLPLRAPAARREPGGLAAGWFALDLATLPRGLRGVTVHAFSGPALADPVDLDLRPRERS